jgi:hypothetical protein
MGRPEGLWEGVDHSFHPLGLPAGDHAKVWMLTRSAFTYRAEPAVSADESAEAFLARLCATRALPSGDVRARQRGLSRLGAIPLTDGRVLVGFHHPTAAAVHLTGDFNGWQHPWYERPDPVQFVPLTRILVTRGRHGSGWRSPTGSLSVGVPVRGDGWCRGRRWRA